MEQTIGKRIAQNRKRLGLTQDQLAEKLGVTAQAVSKWENDQSCPDITMLPKLAEIFGVTTDELLGRETSGNVREAEIVSEEEAENEGVHIQKGKWSFRWDSGRRDSVILAVLVLWVGILTLLSKIYNWNVSFWEILWPSGFFIYGLFRMLPKFSVFYFACFLFGGYFLVHNLGIWQLNVGGELVWPIMIVLFGVSLLLDALKKPRKPRVTITHDGRNVASGNKKTKSECVVEEECFHCSLTFGEKTQNISMDMLAGGEASVSFGELRVNLTECKEIREGCTVHVSCTFGEMVLLVPRRFRVEPDVRTAFAAFNTAGQPDPEPEGVILLNGSVSFGEMVVKYI